MGREIVVFLHLRFLTSIVIAFSTLGIQNDKGSEEDEREEGLQGQVEGGHSAKGFACDLVVWISGMF